MKTISLIFTLASLAVIAAFFFSSCSCHKDVLSCKNSHATAIERFSDYLKRNGIKYESVDEGDIAFKFRGYTLIGINDQKDPCFLRLLLFTSYDKEDEQKVSQVLNTMNCQFKMMKAFYETKDTTVTFSIEHCIPDCNVHLDSIFERNLDVLEESFTEFCRTMKVQN